MIHNLSVAVAKDRGVAQLMLAGEPVALQVTLTEHELRQLAADCLEAADDLELHRRKAR